ncbi:hypothetical protein D3C80_1770540 [compost metagenome]
MGQRLDAVLHRLCRIVRKPVRPQLFADRQTQSLDGSPVAGADRVRRPGGRVVVDDQLRPGPAPGHSLGLDLHRGDFRGGDFRLVARPAGGALLHHCLVGVFARRHRQYPDGAGLPA